MQFSPDVVQQVINDPANAETMRESKRLWQDIMKRSSTDKAYRQQLLTSPKDAIAAQYRETFGREVPAEALAADIQFVEPQGDFTYVLPQRAGAEGELSESELATVAGGGTPALVLTYIAGVAVTTGVVWVVEKITD